jgi:formylglycine-generating enzyme required for sulfatase activity
MHGNVWQWCQDRYGEGYYSNSTLKDPPGPEGGDARVLRGGAWLNEAASCRAGCRYQSAPGVRHNDCGFRVAFRLD